LARAAWFANHEIGVSRLELTRPDWPNSSLFRVRIQRLRVHMIRRCQESDFETICQIINDGAQAYRGVIPPDRWKEPYMSREELRDEICNGVEFWGFDKNALLQGVMGIQPVQDVTLIRHAYVRTDRQKTGIGAQLLAHLRTRANGPVLIGTWADATWAIRFYEKHGFHLVSPEAEKDRLLKKYWTIPDEQRATSVVLADYNPRPNG
jgi:N-acetylglutamate synthase-like GNAT family acetyltransferase